MAPKKARVLRTPADALAQNLEAQRAFTGRAAERWQKEEMEASIKWLQREHEAAIKRLERRLARKVDRARGRHEDAMHALRREEAELKLREAELRARASIAPVSITDLPEPALRRILLGAAHDNLLRHVSGCARVCAEWRRIAMGSVAYGLGLPRKRDEYLEREDRDNEEERQRWAAAGHGEWLPRGYVCGDVYRPHYRPGDDDRARVLRLIEGKLRPSSAPGTIVFLDEQDGGIGDEGAAVLAAALLSMPRIRFTGLKLTDSDLSSVGVDALVPALRRPWGFSSSQLVGGYVGMKELWVGGGSETGGGGDEFTGIGDAGVTALAKVLPPTLEDLDFAYAGCSDVGFLAMVAALPALSRLTVLWCHCNPRVTARGWTAVFRTLPSLPALERLFASGSSMGLEGARALTAAIPECPRLRELCVDANDLPPEAQDALDAVGIQEGVMMELD